MDSLIKLLDKGPTWLPTVVLLLFLILLVVAIVGLFLGIIQGREVKFWPPSIGPKPQTSSSDPKTASSSEPKPRDAAEEIGFVRYNRDSHALDDVKAQSLRQAKEEVWFIGATMHYTFQNSKELFVEKVQQGVRVNVLIADPTGREFESTARSFGQRKKELDAESRMTLAACRDVLNRIERTPNVKGCLSVKLLDRVFMAGLYIFDPRTDMATMLLVPHITGHDAPLVPGFVVKRTKSGVFNDYFELYSSVWNRAQSFELWRRENSEYLPDQDQDVSVCEEK